MIDMRREHALHNREMRRLQEQIGETIVWFRMSMDSLFHPIYDDLGRTFEEGVLVDFIWIDQVEDPSQYTAEGRRPTNRLRGALSTQVGQGIGLNTDEAHGGRVFDPLPGYPEEQGRPIAPYRDDRNNDVIYYDGRYWSVSNYQIRGRMKGQDNVIGVSAIEIKPDELSLFVFPGHKET